MVNTCYKNHGYPPGYKFYKGKTGQVNNIVTTDEVVSKHSQKKQENRDFHLTGQQYQLLSKLFRQHSCYNPVNPAHVNQVGSFTADLTHKATYQSLTSNIYDFNSVKKTGNYSILDSGATNHVCTSLSASNVGSFRFSLLFKFLSLSFLLAFIVWEISFYMALFTTSKASIIVRIKIIEFLAIIPVGGLILVFDFLQEFSEFPGQQTKSFSITILT